MESNHRSRNTPHPSREETLEQRVDQQNVLIISQGTSENMDIIEEAKVKLREKGYKVIIRKTKGNYEKELASDPAIVVLDTGADQTYFEQAAHRINQYHRNKTSAYGPILLAQRKGEFSWKWSGLMGDIPIISRSNLANANGEWKDAVDRALHFREQMAVQMARLKIGVIGYGNVGRAFVHTSVSNGGEPFDLKVLSRDHDKAMNYMEHNVHPIRSLANVDYKKKIGDLVADTDLTFVCMKQPLGNRPKKTLRDWCWKENAAAIENLAEDFMGYKGLVVMVTNLPEINAYKFREKAKLANTQVVSLGNLDAMRVFYYANEADDGEAKRIIGLDEGEDITDCFVFGSHNMPVPGVSLMKSIAIKGNYLVNANNVAEFRTYISEKLLKELPDYLKHGEGITDDITGNAMADVAKAVYDNRIVTLGLPYQSDSLKIPLQRPCNIKRVKGNRLLRAMPTSTHGLIQEELDDVHDARLDVIKYLSKLGHKFDANHIDKVNLN